MLERGAHGLTGWVRFEITGEPGRFLTLAARRGVALWGMERREEGAAACCRPRDYPRLREPARRCGVRLRLTGRGGAPFLLRRLRRRPGLLAGAPLAAVLIWVLGGFVWGVRVAGNETLGDRMVLEAAAQCGVAVGAERESFVPKEAAHRLVGLLPQLDWAALNTDGCFVEVAVREGESKPEMVEEKLSNLVAEREGLIVTVEAESGRPEVQPGQTVEAGDLLIAGLYRERLDPWSPRTKAYQQAGSARGRVLAETVREFTVHVSAQAEEAQEGTPQRRLTWEVLGLRLPGNVFPEPEGETRRGVRRTPLVVLGVELPVALEVETVTPVTREKRTRTEEELRRDALWKLRQAQRAALPAGTVIREEALEWAFPDGMCLLTARCRCREDIAVEREVLVKETENEEDF